MVILKYKQTPEANTHRATHASRTAHPCSIQHSLYQYATAVTAITSPNAKHCAYTRYLVYVCRQMPYIALSAKKNPIFSNGREKWKDRTEKNKSVLLVRFNARSDENRFHRASIVATYLTEENSVIYHKTTRCSNLLKISDQCEENCARKEYVQE